MVVHVMVAPEEVTDEAATEEIVGPVVSAADKVVAETELDWLELLPAAS